MRGDADHAVERFDAFQRSFDGVDVFRFVGFPVAVDEDEFDRNDRYVQPVLEDSTGLHRLEVFVGESSGLQEFPGARGERQKRYYKDRPEGDHRVSPAVDESTRPFKQRIGSAGSKSPRLI